MSSTYSRPPRPFASPTAKQHAAANEVQCRRQHARPICKRYIHVVPAAVCFSRDAPAAVQSPSKIVITPEALASGLGSAIGDALGQAFMGQPPSLDSLQLGLYSTLLQAGPRHCQTSDASKPFRSPIADLRHYISPLHLSAILCILFALSKLVHGQPGLVLSTFQDKLVATAAANYVLWPLANFLNKTLVPKQHQGMTHVLIYAIWSASLSSLNHAPNLASLASDLPTAPHLMESVYNPGIVPAETVPSTTQTVQTVLQNVLHPIADQAAQAIQSSTDLLDSVPSTLLQEMLGDALDLVTPVRRFCRSPSQLGQTGNVCCWLAYWPVQVDLATYKHKPTALLLEQQM